MAPATAAASLLLDTYTGAAAAYSLRKLRTAYAGSAVRVRRSSDNAEADIGFTAGGALDTTALMAHVGAGNSGYVTTWYDQDSGTNATQSTAGAQPRIVNAGTVDVDADGNAQLYFDGTNHYFNAGPTLELDNATIFAVANWAATNTRTIIGDAAGGLSFDVTSALLRLVHTNTAVIGQSNHNISTGVQYVVCATYSAAGAYAFRENAVDRGSGTSDKNIASVVMYVGAGASGTGKMSGYISEVLVWASVQSGDNIAAIETNLNTYYTVY